jgi:anti-sigma factor RsiW
MNETRRCQDKDALITYLYGEADDVDRQEIEAHLAGCPACASELEGLRGVRTTLAEWRAPDQALGFRLVRDPVVVPIRRRWWTAPAWAQAAAAVLLLAAAAAVANLDVRYGRDGIEIRTGWQVRPAETAAATVPGSAARQVTPVAGQAASAPWRAELTAFEQRMQQDLASRMAAQPARTVTTSAPGPDEAQVVRWIDARIQVSEERQRRQLARSVLQVNQDFDAQRRADLARIERGLGQIGSQTWIEATQQRQMINYLMQVSQKK